ncbi:MAG: YkgJ family cysteine cluster protein [Haloferacaceae archaeon]
MDSLEAELERARDLAVADLADAVEAVGFECTRCGACCKGYVDGCGDGTGEADGSGAGGDETGETDGSGAGGDETGEAGGGGAGGDGGPAGDGAEPGPDDAEGAGDPHTATVFPDEVRRLREAAAASDDPALADEYDWRDVARPMPYGLREDGTAGETFEWALATDDCGDCTFYDGSGGEGRCAVHDDRPLVCRTYPFSVDVGGTSQPMGGVVEEAGPVRAHECEGLGRDISRADAEDLARALKERAVRELEEAIAVREAYAPADADGVVVHDSEGAKRPDGRPLRGDRAGGDGPDGA